LLKAKAKAKAKALTFKAKAKAKDLTLKAKAKAKDSKFVLEDTPRPRTKAKDNNTGYYFLHIFRWFIRSTFFRQLKDCHCRPTSFSSLTYVHNACSADVFFSGRRIRCGKIYAHT